MVFKSIFALIFLIQWNEAKLPTFIKTCNQNRTDFTKCVQDNVNYAFPYLLKGVNDFAIPPLKILKLPKIHSPSYLPYRFNFNGHLLGFEGIFYNQSTSILEKFLEHGSFHFPKLELQGKYNINGTVGAMQITGRGLANITLHNLTIETIWSSAAFKHKEVDYVKLTTSALVSYHLGSASYHFDNLFNGNKTQGEAANQLLNKQWWILGSNFFPSVPNFFLKLIFQITNHILSYTSFNEMFASQ